MYISIRSSLLIVVATTLSGCDIETILADPVALQKEAEGKAVGGSCRQGLRAIEDCFSLNPKASKAAIFSGWKDMDQYMRDNKLDGVEPKGFVPSMPPEEDPKAAARTKN